MSRGFTPLRIVIVGGVAAGMAAAARARRNNARAQITVVQKEDVISYGACGFPYYISGEIKKADALFARDISHFRSKNIEVLTGHKALAIDRRRKAVRVQKLSDGSQLSFFYDKLILATGARAKVPAIDGLGLDGVFSLRHWADMQKISGYMEQRQPSQAVIVGAGYTGLEMAEALCRKGMSVTVIEKSNKLLQSAEEEIHRHIVNTLRLNDVKLITGCSVLALSGEGRVQKAQLSNGADISCDMVLISAGITPNSGLALDAGLKLGTAGAIEVDSRMQTSDANIYAAGDCATSKHLITRKTVWAPLGTTANKQGRVAADNACSRRSIFKGVMGTSVVRVFNLEVGQTGLGWAQASGYYNDVESVTIDAPSRAGYYPGAEKVTVKLVFRKTDGLLLGGHLCGKEGIAKRVDVLATALAAKMTLSDVADLDLSYAPPFAPVWDPLLVAANVGLKKVKNRF